MHDKEVKTTQHEVPPAYYYYMKGEIYIPFIAQNDCTPHTETYGLCILVGTLLTAGSPTFEVLIFFIERNIYFFYKRSALMMVAEILWGLG